MTRSSRAAVTLVSLLVMSAAMSAPGAAQPPTASPEPVSSSTTIGPSGLEPPPSPPIGEPWSITVDRPTFETLDARVVVCGGGFTLLASGRDAKDRIRAYVWTSPDGREWSHTTTLRPGSERRYWLVTELLVFHDALYALGGDGRRLAVWRSDDCGVRWERLRDPSFSLGRDAVALSHGVEAAATGDRMLVVAHQGGEEIPDGQWAWTLDADGDWHRIAGGLDAELDWGVGSTGTTFFAVDWVTGGLGGSFLVTSTDGVTWGRAGTMPSLDGATWDPVAQRYLTVSQEPHDAAASAPVIWSSVDGSTWSALAAGAPTNMTYGSTITARPDGLLVWTINAGHESDGTAWSWVGTSVDGGVTWAISAGWPDMAFVGGASIAIGASTIVLAGGYLGLRVWTSAVP